MVTVTQPADQATSLRSMLAAPPGEIAPILSQRAENFATETERELLGLVADLAICVESLLGRVEILEAKGGGQ